MRRIDHDGHVARQGPLSFRVLAVPDTAYLSPTSPTTAPPPPRAPEPYKIAPSSTSFGRAHRRSSFVILAESRPASPDPDNASPNLPTGRVSPFRGRGFKGPPPHSMSRPQSPEVAGDGRRRRVERRVSLSQQNSPRKSLIPQPTYRQRSTSLTKANERSPSPKIGRRVDSKTRLNVSNSQSRLNAAESKTRLNDSRTHLNKSDSKSRTNFAESKIRFISNSTSNLSSNSTTMRRQTTTKPSTRLSPIQGTPTKPEKAISQSNIKSRNASRQSPMKTSRMSQKNNVATTRRDNQNKNSSKERLLSPSKIPLKTNGSSNTNRFISTPEQNLERFVKMEKTDKVLTEDRNDKQTANQSLRNGQSSEPNSKESETDKNSSGNMDEMDLINLLKQTSQTTGTSSERLVNTTTTTAVQPLHIDANTLLMEPNQQKEQSEEMSRSISPASKEETPVSTQNTASMHQRSVENQSVKANQASNNPGSDNKDSSVGAQSNSIKHIKSGSIGQSTKDVIKNDEDSAHQHSNQSSANQRSGRNSQNARGSKQNDGKTPEESETMEVKSGSASSKVAASSEIPNDKMPTVMENDSKIARTAEKAETTINNATTVNNTMTNSKTANNNNSVNSAVGAVNASVNSGTVVRTRNENRGSDASLKSSAGASTGSIKSVRSTDTGVSVNTVRGVSSPREKTGVHMVKRSQEIETLSGNIVHIEQNGEPTVLASSNEKEQSNEKLLARWRRSLSQYSKCCSGMRCLACRRDPKGLLWTRNQKRAMVINDTPPPPAPPPVTNALSCWSKLKSRCKCTGLREMNCCTRKSRVAPAESTVCCPPERRCGAICRRVFGCCSCKRTDTQERTKNTRAKHSLTSVAPPPLSEEPKAKLPDVLVEYNSVMRGAIPCLPIPLAWFCLIWNVLLPGTGTIWSGLFNLCTGQPRFSPVAGLKSRLGAFIVNLVVGVGQLFTVLFCLVGWGWSIWWGVTMVRLARKYKRFKASEAANNDPEARGGEPGPLPPGVPSQALREMERAR
ncbi:protein stum isoform X2 [Cataglyphis hispanica]|nr:protein stum isoform X2 [Cataglyphis hispanica]XP_050460549.1 protein stum isoform X2 [Cataglyphis hispanica]XP_050460550.1 protein stum isoform X2 [Cataglyphis hispanica]XP_050460551.1 protein stum isoform X2 [Cataglyphis hispanica]